MELSKAVSAVVKAKWLVAFRTGLAGIVDGLGTSSLAFTPLKVAQPTHQMVPTVAILVRG